LTPARIVAIAFIYVCTAIAWFALGGSVVQRTGQSDERLAAEVAQLWGGHHTQVGPNVYYEVPRNVVEDVQDRDAHGALVTRQVTRTVIDRIPIPLTSSRVRAEISLDQRRKGLLWYNTYGVAFAATYRLRKPEKVEGPVFVHFTFPSTEAIYDGFTFKVDGRDAPPTTDLSQGAVSPALLKDGAETQLDVSYHSRGLGAWFYALTPSAVSQVKDFELDMKTDFKNIDFPPGTLSPTGKVADGPGWKLTWAFQSLVTGQKIGMDPPNRLNPGPLASRITFFAPVSLLFFVTVMVILGVLKGQSLHPMNYFFLAAAFFAFHLLLAYLVDHVDLNLAFLISSATSIFLVVSYLRLVAGMRFALVQAGLAQFIFLVLFSYAFFFEGYTGLTVTVGAIVTLFVLMQLTGRVNWGKVLSRQGVRVAQE